MEISELQGKIKSLGLRESKAFKALAAMNLEPGMEGSLKGILKVTSPKLLDLDEKGIQEVLQKEKRGKPIPLKKVKRIFRDSSEFIRLAHHLSANYDEEYKLLEGIRGWSDSTRRKFLREPPTAQEVREARAQIIKHLNALAGVRDLRKKSIKNQMTKVAKLARENRITAAAASLLAVADRAISRKAVVYGVIMPWERRRQQEANQLRKVERAKEDLLLKVLREAEDEVERQVLKRDDLLSQAGIVKERVSSSLNILSYQPEGKLTDSARAELFKRLSDAAKSEHFAGAIHDAAFSVSRRRPAEAQAKLRNILKMAEGVEGRRRIGQMSPQHIGRIYKLLEAARPLLSRQPRSAVEIYTRGFGNVAGITHELRFGTGMKKPFSIDHLHSTIKYTRLHLQGYLDERRAYNEWRERRIFGPARFDFQFESAGKNG